MEEPGNEAGWADDLRARRMKPEKLRREWAAVIEEVGVGNRRGKAATIKTQRDPVGRRIDGSDVGRLSEVVV